MLIRSNSLMESLVKPDDEDTNTSILFILSAERILQGLSGVPLNSGMPNLSYCES